MSQLSFGEAQRYRIVVAGSVAASARDCIGSLKVTAENAETALEGEVHDQAELMGVLNTLYHLHLPILSVRAVIDDQPSGPELTDMS